MGNANSSSSSSRRRSASPETAADRAKKMVADLQSSVQSSVNKFDDDHPAAQLLDSICAPIFDDDKLRSQRTNSYAYSEDYSEDDSRTISEEDTVDDYDRGRRRKKDTQRGESSSMMSQSDYESDPSKRPGRRGGRREGESDSQSQSFDSEEDHYASKKNAEKSVVTDNSMDVGPGQLSKPLASSFAKRCYFTKAGIGKTTQHYEGLTLTGNVVLMLAAAMKLKGCPTICDEDLRRVEQTYPNQFSRLPDELLLSSGWRRISKYCHFSNKPIPDGVPFFHSKKRAHPSGGYYFLLAAAVGMIRPIDVEALTRDTLVLLETDYPTQSDAAPEYLIQNPNEWTLVDKFCFFSGGPINTEEDVYYQADFDGNPIYMLAFLSPSLTPEELYKLNIEDTDEPGLKSVGAVEEVESVYDLTERDFDDLKLYHLGPCRALPPYILQPQAWRKVLPPHFLAARHRALMKAQHWEESHAVMTSPAAPPATMPGHSGISVEQGLQPMAAEPMQYEYVPQMPSNGQFVEQDWSQNQMQPQSSVATNSNPGYYPQHPQHSTTSSQTPYAAQHQSFAPAPMPQAGSAQHLQSGFPYYDHASPRGGHLSVQTQNPSEASAQQSFQREVEEEGAFVDSSVPIDEALALRQMRSGLPPSSPAKSNHIPLSPPGFRGHLGGEISKMDPPDDEPPSLSKREDSVVVTEGEAYHQESYPESYHESDGIQQHYQHPEQHSPYQQSRYSEKMEPPDHETASSGYYQKEAEFYDSPSKGVDGQDYDAPQEEYYDAHRSPMNGGYSHDNPHYFDSPPNGQKGGSEFYVSPEKSEFTNPAYSGTEDEYYGSPSYTEDTAFSDENRRSNFVPIRKDKPAPSPANRSPPSEVSRNSSEYTPTSAMRTAQDLLKKNRQKRLEMAMRRQQQARAESETNGSRTNEDAESQATWDSGSEITSVISGSSVWTDGSNAGDRSSRRALILQMAKARMKSNKSSPAAHSAPIAEESSMTSTAMSRDPDQFDQEEARSDVKTDIDFSEDLD